MRPMSVPRRIVTGHDESGKSVILSDTPSPKTTDIGTAAALYLSGRAGTVLAAVYDVGTGQTWRLGLGQCTAPSHSPVRLAAAHHLS